jgi:hypothetical protein
MLSSASQWMPIATFLLGWGSGVITAWAMYRDHDRRLDNVEKIVAHLAETTQKTTQDVAVVYQKLRDTSA